jgi:oxygen-independent coproporphyrinogen-3 oxidase
MPFCGTTADRYAMALLKELASSVDLCLDRGEVNSIYFGGGTPSLLSAEQISAILDCCRSLFPISQDCEISLEANPGTVSPEKAFALRHAGVNRVSLGAQSFDDLELSSIGRVHTVDMISSSVSRLRAAGFYNINLDLMLGLPGQTVETWRRNLEAIERLSIQHVSVYMLDLDDQCPLYQMTTIGSVHLPDEDLISDLYLETIKVLSQYGYSQYEISNFAKPGYNCRHNLKYWQREPVHGLGLGSHSFDGDSRYSNCSKIDDYFDSIDMGKSAINWREPVTAAQSLAEELFLGLRLTRGVDWNWLRRTYGSNCLAQYEPGMSEFSERGLVEWDNSTLRLTPSGMLLSNEIFQLFI